MKVYGLRKKFRNGTIVAFVEKISCVLREECGCKKAPVFRTEAYECI